MDPLKDLDLRYCFNILNKYKVILIVLVVAVALSSTIKEKRKPTLYKAKVTCLATGGGGGGFSSSTGYLQKLGISVSGGGPDSASLISAIIYSRRMAKDITAHFKKRPISLETYSAKGVFGIMVVASEPEFAVNVANFCVSNLDKINNELDFILSNNFLSIKFLFFLVTAAKT